MDLTKEQLAQQHARVLSLQQRGVGQEEVCQERLAEQQLRLKQVRACVRVGGNVCRNGVELYGLTALFVNMQCYMGVWTLMCSCGCGCVCWGVTVRSMHLSLYPSLLSLGQAISTVTGH